MGLNGIKSDLAKAVGVQPAGFALQLPGNGAEGQSDGALAYGRIDAQVRLRSCTRDTIWTGQRKLLQEVKRGRLLPNLPDAERYRLGKNIAPTSRAFFRMIGHGSWRCQRTLSRVCIHQPRSGTCVRWCCVSNADFQKTKG